MKMKPVWRVGAMVLTGAIVTAMCAMSQSYTTSAKPGAINYIEGNASLDGQPLSFNNQQYGPRYLNPNETLSTTNGKAEVLLTPGVFLRLGDNSAVRMVSADLTNTQVALERGEAIIEVDQLVKGNNISVLDGRATVTVKQTGLYRLAAGPQPTAAVYDGKLLVREDDHQIELKKGHQTEVAGVLKSQKFERNQEDALYAWSNVRSEYNSAASYQLAKNIYVNNYYGGPWGFGEDPGWYWDAGFDGFAWLPYDGAFYSPFGWGFFGPAYVPYVVGGHGWHGGLRGTPGTHIAAAGRASGFHGFAGGGFHSGFAGGGFHGGGFHGGGGGRR